MIQYVVAFFAILTYPLGMDSVITVGLVVGIGLGLAGLLMLEFYKRKITDTANTHHMLISIGLAFLVSFSFV